MSRTTIREDHPAEAGFTLIEVLVALVVLTISLGAIGALASSSLHSTVTVERHLALVQTARKIMTALPDRDDLGRTAGTMGPYRWQVDAEPFETNPADSRAGAPWIPTEIIVSVIAPTGDRVRMETVRLRHRAGS